MNQAIPASLVLGVVAAILAAYAFWRFWRTVEAVRASLAEAVRVNAAAFAQLAEAAGTLTRAFQPAANGLAENMSIVPKLLENIAKVGTMQVQIMQAQRTQNLNPFGRPNQTATGNRNVAASEMEYDVQQMMRAENISREEALMRLNPANAGSVWGSEFFDGWRQQ